MKIFRIVICLALFFLSFVQANEPVSAGFDGEKIKVLNLLSERIFFRSPNENMFLSKKSARDVSPDNQWEPKFRKNIFYLLSKNHKAQAVSVEIPVSNELKDFLVSSFKNNKDREVMMEVVYYTLGGEVARINRVAVTDLRKKKD